jgi:plasmid stabilization system protein ParE
VNPRSRLTPEAQANVDEIGAFIADDSVDAALRVLDALEDAFSLLAATPEIGHKREDLTTRPVKFWSVYSYLVVYDPASAPLTIVAVLHGARDVERLLKAREQ